MNDRRPCIVIAEPNGYPEGALANLRAVCDITLGPFTRDQFGQELQACEAAVIRFAHRVDADLLGDTRTLRVISCAATGSDHIDLQACSERDISVQTLKGETAFLRTVTATAELTWWHILEGMRRASLSARHVFGGGWNRDVFVGSQLFGKTLGIVGLGRLGIMVADIGAAFGMKVIASDPDPAITPDHVEMVSTEALFSRADVVTLHADLNPTSKGMVNANLLSRLKAGSILVNTARGDLVREDDLIAALDAGQLAAVGLDVLATEGEKPQGWPRSNLIWQRMQTDDRIRITPHIGGATVESMGAAETFMAGKLLQTLGLTLDRAKVSR
jgi:D-3-phosphoglycerate dehydrogenase|tara:strand:+ start:28887 stop:29876 length:990 start_codon:yes stop_codon:yes gene_type:complete